MDILSLTFGVSHEHPHFKWYYKLSFTACRNFISMLVNNPESVKLYTIFDYSITYNTCEKKN